MRSKKNPEIVPFEPYESKEPFGREFRYTRLGKSLLSHDKFLSLSHEAVHVYVYMKLESSGKEQFCFPVSKYSKIISKNGFRSAIDELINKGFVKKVKANSRNGKATIYAFSEDWKKDAA